MAHWIFQANSKDWINLSRHHNAKRVMINNFWTTITRYPVLYKGLRTTQNRFVSGSIPLNVQLRDIFFSMVTFQSHPSRKSNRDIHKRSTHTSSPNGLCRHKQSVGLGFKSLGSPIKRSAVPWVYRRVLAFFDCRIMNKEHRMSKCSLHHFSIFVRYSIFISRSFSIERFKEVSRSLSLPVAA